MKKKRARETKATDNRSRTQGPHLSTRLVGVTRLVTGRTGKKEKGRGSIFFVVQERRLTEREKGGPSTWSVVGGRKGLGGGSTH